MGAPQPGVIRNASPSPGSTRDDADVPVAAVRRDDASIARFRSHGYSRTDLLHDTDAWSGHVADATWGRGRGRRRPPPKSSSRPGSGMAGWRRPSCRSNPTSTSTWSTPAGAVWNESVLGWDVTVRYESITGILALGDITLWVGSARWDTAVWGKRPLGHVRRSNLMALTPTVGTGQIITPTWGNAIRDRTIQHFATEISRRLRRRRGPPPPKTGMGGTPSNHGRVYATY